MRVFAETGRLLLRQFTEADVNDLADLHGDPDVMRFITGGRTVSREVIQRETLPRYLSYYARGAGYGYWAAIEKASGAFVGWFFLRPPVGEPDAERMGEFELGYRLRRGAWGKGYATEGAQALMRIGFTRLGAQRVVANAFVANVASCRVLEKAGLRLVRITHPEELSDIEEAEQGDAEYALDKSEWERQVAHP